MSYEPKPSLPRHIHSPVDHYDVDVETGTVTYHVVQTNGDRIRSMSDEELAEFLETVNSCTCSFVMGKSPCVADGCPCWLEWLREEVKE